MDYPEKPVRRATRSWPDLGGLQRFVANSLANLVGMGEYVIGTLPHPKKADELKVALEFAARQDVNDVYVDKDKIVYVFINGQTGWLPQYNAAGIVVTNGKNHNKYRKSVYRPTEIGFEFPDDMHIDVVVLDPDQVRAMSREDLSPYSDEEVEMIADGMFVFNKRVWRMMVDSVQGNRDAFKTARRKLRVRNSHEFNVRVFSESGFIKGDAVRAHGDLPFDAMLYTSHANVKNAIKVLNGGKRFLIAQPNGGKDQAFSNIQELAWFFSVPNGTTQLFTMETLQRVLDDYLEKAFRDIVDGKLTERFTDVESFLWKHMKDLDDEDVANSFTLLQRYSVIEAAMRGFDYRTSPSMLRSVATNHRTVMKDFNGHPRFPLPNAEYKAVKSVTMLRMAGYEVETPERGFIEYHEPMDVWYVCDRDWIDSYIDFGGQDGDDHFTVMSIVDSNNEHRIIAWRMPMDSYKMFRTNSPGISYVDSRGNETFAFQMSKNSDVNKFPKPLSELIRAGKVTITGLPSQQRGSSGAQVRALTREDVMDEIRGLSGQNAALGAYVNSLFLYRWVFKTLPKEIPGMVSDVVDTNDPEDALFIMEYSARLVEEVLDSGKPIPSSYWNTTREYGFNRVLQSYTQANPGYQVNFTETDKLSRMTSMLDDSILRFDKRVSVFAQENHGLIDESILALFQKGDPLLQESRRLVVNYRSSFPAENRRVEAERQSILRGVKQGEPIPTFPKGLPPESYAMLRQPIMDAIMARDGDERDRFVLALYVAAHTVPRKGGGFNDDFIVTSQAGEDGQNVGAFPHLMNALRNFGYIADSFSLNDEGQLEMEYKDLRSWTLTCNTCGTKYLTARQGQYDAYMSNGCICKRCR